MEEVIAIWSSATEGVKKYVPKLTWEGGKVRPF